MVIDPEARKRGATVLSQIEAAFRDVKLGDGLSLSQAAARDDYVDAPRRHDDEITDWRRIPDELLEANYFALTFMRFDESALRFHLPAFMCCALRHAGEPSLAGERAISVLTPSRHRHAERDRKSLLIFNPVERQAIVAFLGFMAHPPIGDRDANVALRRFWASTSLTGDRKRGHP